MLEADHGLVAVARVSHAQAGQLRSLGHENVTRKPLTFVTDSPLTRTFYDSRNSQGFSHPRVRLFQPHQPSPRVNHVLRLTRDRTGPTASHGGATLRSPDRALLPFGHMCESIPVSAPADGMQHQYPQQAHRLRVLQAIPLRALCALAPQVGLKATHAVGMPTLLRRQRRTWRQT